MSPGHLEGKTYGPTPWRVDATAAADFIAVTGDDPDRWSKSAPPGFAASALFAVAPELLAELYELSVIHGEQTFQWHSNIPIEALLEVTGTVGKARERGGVHFLTFDISVTDEGEPVLEGRSLFLVGGEPTAGEHAAAGMEPPHSSDGDPGDGEVAASRADLIRYAAATRDWNPVHWDHEAAVAAGFPGVVVHGLLQTGWALRAAAAGVDSERPFSRARVRFRQPMLPARPARVVVEPGEGSVNVTISDDESVYLTASVDLANG